MTKIEIGYNRNNFVVVYLDETINDCSIWVINQKGVGMGGRVGGGG